MSTNTRILGVAMVLATAAGVAGCAYYVELNRVPEPARSKLQCSDCDRTSPPALYQAPAPTCHSTGHGMSCPAPTPSWRRYVPERDAYGPGERG